MQIYNKHRYTYTIHMHTDLHVHNTHAHSYTPPRRHAGTACRDRQEKESAGPNRKTSMIKREVHASEPLPKKNNQEEEIRKDQGKEQQQIHSHQEEVRRGGEGRMNTCGLDAGLRILGFTWMLADDKELLPPCRPID